MISPADNVNLKETLSTEAGVRELNDTESLHRDLDLPQEAKKKVKKFDMLAKQHQKKQNTLQVRSDDGD
jgi:hypothetical protein